MSEIKTINGKVEFLCVPYPSEYEDRIRVVTRYTHPNLDPTKTFDAFLLSEITEEQASLFVDYAECRINGVRVFYDYGNKTTSLPTAKESLFSLLKANGCWTKEWYAEDYEHLPIIRESLCDKSPDDYLLIIKQ